MQFQALNTEKNGKPYSNYKVLITWKSFVDHCSWSNLFCNYFFLPLSYCLIPESQKEPEITFFLGVVHSQRTLTSRGSAHNRNLDGAWLQVVVVHWCTGWEIHCSQHGEGPDSGSWNTATSANYPIHLASS